MNKPAGGEVQKAPGAVKVEIPAADKGWHPIALRWYGSLAVSGQSAFYESGDWWTAYAVAESMSREFKPQPMVVGSGKDAHLEMIELPPKAASLAAWARVWGDLLTTEGARRRLRLELERQKPAGEVSGDVSWIDDARRRLSS